MSSFLISEPAKISSLNRKEFKFNSLKLESALQLRKVLMHIKEKNMFGNYSIFTSSAMKLILDFMRLQDSLTPPNTTKNIQDM